MQLGRINLLALRPLDKSSRTICWIGAPALEHADVDRLVDVGVGSVFPNIWLWADGPIMTLRNQTIQSLAERVIRVNNSCFQSISIGSDFRTERKSVFLRLLHHPAQRSLCKKIALITAPHVGMGTH